VKKITSNFWGSSCSKYLFLSLFGRSSFIEITKKKFQFSCFSWKNFFYYKLLFLKKLFCLANSKTELLLILQNLPVLIWMNQDFWEQLIWFYYFVIIQLLIKKTLNYVEIFFTFNSFNFFLIFFSISQMNVFSIIFDPCTIDKFSSNEEVLAHEYVLLDEFYQFFV
jgi:hypothetical protein